VSPARLEGRLAEGFARWLLATAQVGVGGSGKQSLARLASYICGYEVYQIAVSSTYGINDFKENLLSLYRRAGTKGTPITFLMTDNQIVKEGFLVYINDLLSTGYIADLFTPEDKEAFSNAVRNEVKAAGLMDTNENCWDFFIDKASAPPGQAADRAALAWTAVAWPAVWRVAWRGMAWPAVCSSAGATDLRCRARPAPPAQVRKYLHIVLCFSPVGDKFRVRARQFPALVNCTMFDWFHGWPGEALVSVAQRFLVEVQGMDDGVRENIAYHMAYAHQCVSEASERFKEAFRRYNYTTPKSYLELISLYKTLLAVRAMSHCLSPEPAACP
jgi:dynein heavy chain